MSKRIRAFSARIRQFLRQLEEAMEYDPLTDLDRRITELERRTQ
ncbi:MAG: hypothetical protein AAFR21_12815 [Pseudomonadota bacterium]